MRRPMIALFVTLLAGPALGSELMTKAETSVYAEPSRKARVVAKLPPNVKVASDKRKDFWFHISIRRDGRTVSGWVNQTDVSSTMGRSKGQLLAENRRLYEEVTALRKKTKEMAAALAAAEAGAKAAKAENDKRRAALEQAQAELKRVRAEVQRLKAARKNASKRP